MARLACVLVVVDCAVCQQVVELITHHLVVELDSVLGGPAATARIAPGATNTMNARTALTQNETPSTRREFSSGISRRTVAANAYRV